MPKEIDPSKLAEGRAGFSSRDKLQVREGQTTLLERFQLLRSLLNKLNAELILLSDDEAEENEGEDKDKIWYEAQKAKIELFSDQEQEVATPVLEVAYAVLQCQALLRRMAPVMLKTDHRGGLPMGISIAINTCLIPMLEVLNISPFSDMPEDLHSPAVNYTAISSYLDFMSRRYLHGLSSFVDNSPHHRKTTKEIEPVDSYVKRVLGYLISALEKTTSNMTADAQAQLMDLYTRTYHIHGEQPGFYAQIFSSSGFEIELMAFLQRFKITDNKGKGVDLTPLRNVVLQEIELIKNSPPYAGPSKVTSISITHPSARTLFGVPEPGLGGLATIPEPEREKLRVLFEKLADPDKVPSLYSMFGLQYESNPSIPPSQEKKKNRSSYNRAIRRLHRGY